jgi:hypothetical protein
MHSAVQSVTAACRLAPKKAATWKANNANTMHVPLSHTSAYVQLNKLADASLTGMPWRQRAAATQRGETRRVDVIEQGIDGEVTAKCVLRASVMQSYQRFKTRLKE